MWTYRWISGKDTLLAARKKAYQPRSKLVQIAMCKNASYTKAVCARRQEIVLSVVCDRDR